MNAQTSHLLRIALLGVSALSPHAFGSGFQLQNRSAIGLGRAFSGGSSVADDASVIASNPAAMALLEGEWNYSAGLTYINPNADATLFPTFTGGNVGPATTDDDIAESAVVPHLYLTKRLNEDIVVGIGAFSNYGLRTNYAPSTAALVSTDFSEITTININPSISYRLSDRLTIGAGLDVTLAEGEITSLAPNAGAFPVDLFALDGDDTGFGFNLGILFEASSSTRIGLHYRSGIQLDLEGSATLAPAFNSLVLDGVNAQRASLGASALPAGTVDVDGNFGAELEVELPATIDLSISHDLNSQLTLHGSIVWTEWSTFESLNPNTGVFDAITGAPVDTFLATQQDWEDTFRYAVGATYRHDDRWTFRTGVAYDETPISDSNRTLRIPDGDRLSLSLGASYLVNNYLSLDFGYSYTFVDTISLGENDNGLIGTDSRGEGDIQEFSIGVSGSF